MSQEIEPAQLQALIDRHKNADPPELEKVRAEIEKLGEPVLIPLLKAYREAQERGEKVLAKELDWTIFTSLQIPFKQLTPHIYEAKKKAGWWKDEELVRVMTYAQRKETVEIATSLAKKTEEEADEDISTIIDGSATLVQSLQGTGLIDEYLFLVEPFIIGKGRWFFAEGMAMNKLRLVESNHSIPKPWLLVKSLPLNWLHFYLIRRLCC